MIIMLMIMHTFQFYRYLREALGKHTYLPIFQRRLEFPGENYQKLGCFYNNKARGDIFKEKSISEKFY